MDVGCGSVICVETARCSGSRFDFIVHPGRSAAVRNVESFMNNCGCNRHVSRLCSFSDATLPSEWGPRCGPKEVDSCASLAVWVRASKRGPLVSYLWRARRLCTTTGEENVLLLNSCAKSHGQGGSLVRCHDHTGDLGAKKVTFIPANCPGMG